MVKEKQIIQYPLITEDAVNLIENENKLVFIVNLQANKHSIKKSVEELYSVKVEKVSYLITPKGQKKAFVKLKPEFKASDIAIKLGIF
ncbi:50S ribosomal protein L23 [Candidatus Bathyarchaeota archaeon]|nr:50S ribosomal protein L23 [Candidatus Bathyarchaeota archaeon]